MENEQFIHDYYTNRLSAVDRQGFEHRIEEDPTFAQEVKEYQDIKTAIKESERVALKNILQDLESQEVKEEPLEQTISFSKKYRHIYAAAAVIIFTIIAFQFLEKEPSTQDLYASYYQPYPNTLQPVVRGERNEDKISQAFVAYEANEFSKAAGLFEESLAITYDPDVAFYQAMSLLESKKQVEASILLSKLKKEGTSFKPQLYWYSAMVALKNGQKEVAKQQLDSLAALRSDYKKRTISKLQKELNQ